MEDNRIKDMRTLSRLKRVKKEMDHGANKNIRDIFLDCKKK